MRHRLLTTSANHFRCELVFACIGGEQIFYKHAQSGLHRIKWQAARKHLEHFAKLIIIKVRARSLAISLECRMEDGLKDPNGTWIIVAPVFVTYIHGRVAQGSIRISSLQAEASRFLLHHWQGSFSIARRQNPDYLLRYY